jgi:hypothetical protein
VPVAAGKRTETLLKAMRVLPAYEAARQRPQGKVHEQRDETDADDADIDDIELKERSGILDQRAEPLLRGNQLGGD